MTYIDNKLEEYQAPDPHYNYEHFKYDEISDTYTCPQGITFRTNGSWYKELTRAKNIILFKQYKTPACKSCQVRAECTRSKNGRLIYRSEFAEYYEKNRINYVAKEHLYKRRQAIVEQPSRVSSKNILLAGHRSQIIVHFYSYLAG